MHLKTWTNVLHFSPNKVTQTEFIFKLLQYILLRFHVESYWQNVSKKIHHENQHTFSDKEIQSPATNDENRWLLCDVEQDVEPVRQDYESVELYER